MKATYLSHSKASYGKASGYELIMDCDGKERKQFIMAYGDSKAVHDKLPSLGLSRGDTIELKLQKVTKNGKDYWNPIDISKINSSSSSSGTGSTGGNSGPSGHGAQFRSVEELNRIDCMKLAAQVMLPIIDKKMEPSAIASVLIDIAVLLKNNLDAEFFGFPSPVVDANVDKFLEGMDEMPK